MKNKRKDVFVKTKSGGERLLTFITPDVKTKKNVFSFKEMGSCGLLCETNHTKFVSKNENIKLT